MKERRSAERHNLIMYLQVRDRESDELIGHVVDVSTGGMMVVCDAPFRPAAKHHLRVLLPYTEEERTMDVDVECRWCGRDANEDYFDAGFRFLNTSTGLRDVIHSVVEDVGFAA